MAIFKNSRMELNIQASLGTLLFIVLYVAACLRLEGAYKSAGASCSVSDFDSTGLRLELRSYTSNRLTGGADSTGPWTTI